MTATFEIIEYTAVEMLLVNKATGKQYTYFGCPRAKYDKIKHLLATSRVIEAWQMLKPYAGRDRVTDVLNLAQG